jgi:hypothetical protein
VGCTHLVFIPGPSSTEQQQYFIQSSVTMVSTDFLTIMSQVQGYVTPVLLGKFVTHVQTMEGVVTLHFEDNAMIMFFLYVFFFLIFLSYSFFFPKDVKNYVNKL